MAADRRRWHHAILTTYGAWLHGDLRGFRTRHHRTHVDGDYKSPPAVSKYFKLEQLSRDGLAQRPVAFEFEQYWQVAVALDERLRQLGGWVLCIAVLEKHVHILVKVPSASARIWIGHAKRHVTFQLRRSGWNGYVWGKRSGLTLVRSRKQQENTYRYIVRHAAVGAWVGVRKQEQGNLVHMSRPK